MKIASKDLHQGIHVLNQRRMDGRMGKKQSKPFCKTILLNNKTILW